MRKSREEKEKEQKGQKGIKKRKEKEKKGEKEEKRATTNRKGHDIIKEVEEEVEVRGGGKCLMAGRGHHFPLGRGKGKERK